MGFLPSGFVKVTGERFTALATTHPMGSYLEAFYHTGYYYTFVGIMQITAAILLLIPRTATLGALIYFPIILNICLLSLAVRFEGSLLTSPLMLLANIFLLCWDWNKLKFVFFPKAPKTKLPLRKDLIRVFPIKFFMGSATIVLMLIVSLIYMNNFMFMPANDISGCKARCAEMDDQEACVVLCDCIHTSRNYNYCMEEFRKIS